MLQLKLPKGILSHPLAGEIEALLQRNLRQLWDGGDIALPELTFGAGLQDALRTAARTGHVIQGIEAAEKSLASERRGLQVLQSKTAEAQNPRLSRLMILSNDGSERFYRDVEKLLLEHAGRLWGCLTNASAEDLGQLLMPPQKMARSLMINDRKILEEFLSNLVCNS